MGYERIDSGLVSDDVGFEVVQVQYLRTLSLWEDQIEHEHESEPAVERHPAQNEKGPRLGEEGQGEDGEVNEPRMGLSWIIGTEGFVGEVGREQDGSNGARTRGISMVRSFILRTAVRYGTYEIRSAIMPNILGDADGNGDGESTCGERNWS